MSEWKVFFPFRTGTELDVDGPGLANGSCKVIERTATKLVLKFDMPGRQYDDKVTIVYSQEGAGNYVKVGSEEDNNASIESNTSSETRKIRARRIEIKLKKTGDQEAKIWIPVQGNEEEFKLSAS